MGVVYSNLIRKARRFNVESRAFKAIERKKPVHSPLHPTSKKYYDEIIQSTPDVRKMMESKDKKLDKYLKGVYVTSTGMTPEVVRDQTDLPQNRKPVEDDEFGFWQPTEVPEGQASLPQIIRFIADYQGDPKLWSASAISKEYKLDEKTVGDVLEYYKSFNVYIPKIKKDKGGMYSLKRLLEAGGNMAKALNEGIVTEEPKKQEPKKES